MKFEFNWENGLWENYDLIYRWDSNMSDLAEGQPWPLELIYSHCLIMFNISSENNDFGFNSIPKTTFQKNSHLNALGSKFDLDVK